MGQPIQCDCPVNSWDKKIHKDDCTYTCSEEVSTDYVGAQSRCNKPVKGEGLCGVHLRASVQRAARYKKIGEIRIESERNEKANAEVIERLHKLTGDTTAESYYDRSRIMTTTKIIVESETLLKLINNYCVD